MKNYLEYYKFCPLCSSKIVKKTNFLECTNCNYRIFDNPKTCINVLLRNDKDEILLVKRKFEPYMGWWDFPGGFIDGEENVEQAAKREIQEELGIKIQIEKIVWAYPVKYPYKGMVYNLITIFVTAKLGKQKIKVGDDVSDYGFFDDKAIFKEKISWPKVQLKALRKYYGATSEDRV